jgi:hypothetical protein
MPIIETAYEKIKGKCAKKGKIINLFTPFFFKLLCLH